MNTQTEPPAGPQAETIADLLIKLKAAQQRRIGELAQTIKNAPPVTKCHHCQFPTARLNPERSMNEGRPIWDCENCQRIATADAWARRQIAAGIPVDVRHATVQNWHPGDPAPNSDHPSAFLTAAESFCGADLRNLILAGPPGIGKGHLAAAIANRYLECDHRVRWRIMHRLFEAGHRAYEQNNREDFIFQHVAMHLLILDEIAMVELPKDGERTLYDIIDGRQKARLQTILISNQPAVVVRNWLGAAITDRLRSGGVKFLWGDWPSARGNRTKDHAF